MHTQFPHKIIMEEEIALLSIQEEEIGVLSHLWRNGYHVAKGQLSYFMAIA